MKKIVLAVAVAAMTMASCSIYHPQAVDIPLLEYEGETRIDAAVGMSSWIVLPDVITFGATASHAFTPWLAGQVHANYGGDNWYLQAAPGAYVTLGEKGRLEGYVGLGYGGSGNEGRESQSADTTYGSYVYKGSYALPFAQLNAGWRHLGPFDIAIGLKGGVMLPDYEYWHYSDGSAQADARERYRETNFLFEPQFQLSVGGEHVMYTLRFSWCWLSDLAYSSGKFHYDFITLSNGISVRF